MKKINEIIIVEGKSDKQFLETFLEADILTCNGSAIDGFDIEFVKEMAKNRGVILLTDPDYPGTRIRNELENKIGNVKHGFVRKEFSIKHHKVGVAESTKEEVLLALDNLITYNENEYGTLTMSNLLELGLIGENSSCKRKIIEEKYHLGKCNAKTLLKRLNMLNIKYEDLK